MQKLFNIFLLCSFTCCSLAAFAEEINAPAQEEIPVQEEQKEIKEIKEQTQNVKLETYTNTDAGYSIEFPADWQKNDVPELDLVLFAPNKKTAEHPHASMNIVSNNVGAKIDLEQFYSESEKNLTAVLKDVRVDKTGSHLLNGTPSKWVLYTHVMNGMKFRVLQYFIVSGEMIFLMTFSAEDDDFSDYRSDFENIASTFKIIKSKTPAIPETPETSESPSAPEAPSTSSTPSTSKAEPVPAKIIYDINKK